MNNMNINIWLAFSKHVIKPMDAGSENLQLAAAVLSLSSPVIPVVLLECLSPLLQYYCYRWFQYCGKSVAVSILP